MAIAFYNYPSKVQQIKNASNALITVAKNIDKGLWIDEATLNNRTNICLLCEFKQNNRCSKCGCNLAAKSKLKAMKCPIGKW